MNKLELIGTQDINGIRFSGVKGGFGNNQKSILAKDVATIHHMKLFNVNLRIKEHSNQFKAGEDIIDLLNSTNEFRNFAEENGLIGSNRTKNVYLLSQRGYLKLIKIFDDQKSWEVYNLLLDRYFKMERFIEENDLVGLWNSWSEEDKAIRYFEEIKRRKEIEQARQYLQQSNKRKDEIIKEQNQQISSALPKIDFYDTLQHADTNIRIGDFAKIISRENNGIIIGDYRLRQWMKENGYLMKRRQISVPTQKSVNLGLMVYSEKPFKGNIKQYNNTYLKMGCFITPKGQIYFVKKIKEAFKKGEIKNTKMGERLLNKRQAKQYLFGSRHKNRKAN